MYQNYDGGYSYTDGFREGKYQPSASIEISNSVYTNVTEPRPPTDERSGDDTRDGRGLNALMAQIELLTEQISVLKALSTRGIF